VETVSAVKIAMIVEHPAANVVSGGRYHAWLLSCGLVEIGHQVTMFTQRLPPFLNDLAEHYPQPMIEKTNALDRVKASGFDLVVGYPIVASEFALRVARNARIPCWNFVLDAEPVIKQWASAVASRMHYGPEHTKALKESDLLLSISEFAVPYIKKWTGNERVISLMGCVNSRCADSVVSVQTENRWVTITRLTEHKRLDDLLHAVKKTGIRLDIITSFDAGQVRNRVNGAGLSDRITVHSSPDDREKFGLLKAARGYVGASAYEGLGMPFMEAVYCGLPVVCYDFPILQEVCGEAASYARHANADSLAGKLLEVDRDSFLLVNKSMAAFRIGRKYSFEAMCARLQDVLVEYAK